jgi:hypothetical protein
MPAPFVLNFAVYIALIFSFTMHIAYVLSFVINVLYSLVSFWLTVVQKVNGQNSVTSCSDCKPTALTAIVVPDSERDVDTKAVVEFKELAAKFTSCGCGFVV